MPRQHSTTGSTVRSTCGRRPSRGEGPSSLWVATQHGPIHRLERWPMDLAPQDCDLMAQHDDLDGEIGVTATDEADELDDAAERSVEERQGHCRMLAAWEPRRQSPGRRPWMALLAPTGRHRLHSTLNHCG